MSYRPAVGSRWDEDRVLSLAPDASGAAAGQKVSRGDAAWVEAAAHDETLWGRCTGSGSSAYRVAVDLSGPASRCSCPSRKFPCKHALGLLLRWSRGAVPDQEPVPDDVTEWVASRRARSDKAARPATRSEGADPAVAAKRAARREQRVADGMVELERWLHDQLRGGLATARLDGTAESARMAQRLVDAQAPGVAGLVRDLPWHGGGDRWPDLVLAELARVALLVRAHRGAAAGTVAGTGAGAGADPGVDRAVVRDRVGWSTTTETVLAGPGTPDRWLVLWQLDESDGRLVTRRTHVHGTTSGVDRYVLAFGAGGQAPDTGLVPGTVVDADLHDHPGRPLRAVVGERRGAAGPPDGDRVRAAGTARAVTALADALTRDPWARDVPVVLTGVRPARHDAGWAVQDGDATAVPLVGGGAPLELLARSGGRPVDVAGEMSRDGLRLRAVLGPDGGDG